MTSKAVPLAELSKLLTAVSDHGAQHLFEVETDLNQTIYLLSGAIEKLSTSFMNIHEAVMAQQQEIDQLIETVDVSETEYQKILVLRKKIGNEVNAAVTGLQFQDMTNQLIARVIKRVDGLRESLDALATQGQEMGPEQGYVEIVKMLNEMSASLSVRNTALMGGLSKSVTQENMNSGEIELF